MKDKLLNEFLLIRKIIIIFITCLIPVLYIFYLLTTHGYLFSNLSMMHISFKLNEFYKFFLIILIPITVGSIITGKKKIMLYDKFLIIFLLFTIVSCVFAYNKNLALNGMEIKNEGLYCILFYLLLYFNTSQIEDMKIIKYTIYSLIGVNIIEFIAAFLQRFGWFYTIFNKTYDETTVIGLAGNCNYLGSLMCMFTTLFVLLYYFSNNKYKYLYFIMFIVSYVTLLLANSLGPFLSLFITFFFILIFVCKKKKFNWKRFLIISTLCVTLYPIALYKRDDMTPQILNDVSYIMKKILNINITSTGTIESDDELGTGRLGLWKKTWKLIKRNPLLGYGPDNLSLISKQIIDGDTTYVAKAHNIYLQTWVSSGIVALIGYLGWLIVILINAFKNKNIFVNILGFTILSYSIQGLFNISVMEVAPYFYIVMGLCVLLLNKKLRNNDFVN